MVDTHKHSTWCPPCFVFCTLHTKSSLATPVSCLTRLGLLAMADAEALCSGLRASGFRSRLLLQDRWTAERVRVCKLAGESAVAVTRSQICGCGCLVLSTKDLCTKSAVSEVIQGGDTRWQLPVVDTDSVTVLLCHKWSSVTARV